jgi:hypothetical protein
MNAENAERRLVDAETKLARALQRLHTLRRAALAGGYDPVEFDRALMAYRRAEQEALQAREAWTGASDNGAVGALARPVPPDSQAEPFQPTPYLRFIRWLVDNGRLSEWTVD